MKKAIWSFVFILVGLYFFLTFLDRNGNYVVEQKLWKANRKLAQIVRDPAVIPDQTYVELVNDYQRIIDTFPKSDLRPRTMMLLAQVYITKKDYVSARRELQKIVGIYPDRHSLLSEVYLEIGRSYESEGDWAQARKNYDLLIEKFSTTDVGLGIPLYIANYHKSKKESVKETEALNQAVAIYSKLVAKNPDSEIEFKALKYLANTCLLQKRWKEGLETFGEILLKYPTPRRAAQIVQTINAVSVIELKDFNVPISIYQKILDKDPQHPMNKILKKMIIGFTELKEKNAQVVPKE